MIWGCSFFVILHYFLLLLSTYLWRGKKSSIPDISVKKITFLAILSYRLKRWFALVFLLMIYLRVGLYLETVQNNSGLTLGKSVRNVTKCNYMPYMQRWQLTVKVLGTSSTHILYLILFIYTYVNYTFSSNHILHKSFCSLCFWDWDPLIDGF